MGGMAQAFGGGERVKVCGAARHVELLAIAIARPGRLQRVG